MNKVVFISVVCMIFILMNSASAMDINYTSTIDDSNLLQENNKIVFSSQNLEVSSNSSISETNSHEDNYPDVSDLSDYGDNGFLKSQYISEDSVGDEEKIATSLRGSDTELYFKNGTSFNVVLTDNNGSPLSNQIVIFTINNNNYTRITGETGVASIKINLNSGSYGIIATYIGNDVYEGTSTSNTVKILTTISGSDIEKYYKNDTQYYASFLDGRGNPLTNTVITFNINGVHYNRTTNDYGIARLNINLNAGTYVLTAINPINGEMYSNNIVVLTTISGYDVVKYYKNDTQYYATFITGTGSPVANQDMIFNINGVFYNRATNASGVSKLNINLNPGTYTITAINSHNGEMHSNIITVLTIIFANDLNMGYRNGKFTANVINGVGNPLVNSTVTFNVNGVLYRRTTDANGNASLNINLNTGTYLITSTTHNGLSIVNTITIGKSSSNIVGNDSHLIRGISRGYSVQLLGSNSNPITQATVYFRYDNHEVSAITDSNGEATISISDIEDGTYTIEYRFEGNDDYFASSSSSKIIVADSTVILTGKNITMLYKDGSIFSVTLTDLNKNPLANKTITFNINGKDYNRSTNGDGVATLNLNLNPGTYTVYYTYSTVDSPDYNAGSNEVVIVKRTAKITTFDLSMSYGEGASFNALFTNSDDLPIENLAVIFDINGVSYNSITNASGIASLRINLGVGYYQIVTGVDDLYYKADNVYNNILVNGSVFIADDLDIIVGSTSNYSVTLNDAYGNGIPNTTIRFTYNGITRNVQTNSNGTATISISGLEKGDYAIVYNCSDKSIVGESFIHVLGIISISQLISSANNVNTYIEKNAKLPATVTVGGESYNTAQYLYLLALAVTGINGNDLSNIAVGEVKNPTSPGSASNAGNMYDYVSVAKSILSTVDSTGQMPDSVNSNIGTIGYDGLVYSFTRLLVYYGEKNKLPSYVSVKPLKLYTSQSVLDSVNTISDLSAYLASSKNCEVTNSVIVALAERLTDGLTTSLEKATAIYEYVRDTLSYSFYYNTRYGSVKTLSVKSGNCVDHTHLLIALYRAAGLPARYVHGTCVFSSGNTYGHVWAQVLIGNTWVVTDATSSRNSFGKVANWNNYNFVLKGYYSSLSF